MKQRTKKNLPRFLITVSLLVLIICGWYSWVAFPIISGYGAKILASGIFVQHRSAADVISQDLSDFPVSLAGYSVNRNDSSVTATVWGFASQKAIFRHGAGCTLVNEISEQEMRKQYFKMPPPPGIDPDTLNWPAGNKIRDSIPASVNRVALAKAVDGAMNDTFENKPAFTRSVIVVYDGNIIAEKYAQGFNSKSLLPGWSVSKSITGALVAILVRANKLNPDAPAPVNGWENSGKTNILLKYLLQQSSGLDFRENYTGPSEATNMLFKRGNMGAYIAQLPLKYAPGTVFNYSSGNSNLISLIIRNSVGEKDYHAFPYQALFYKCGMYSALLEPDASGTFVGSSYCFATARDFARFGLLYYNNGVMNGEQILPSGWVKKTTEPATADKQQHYGLQFWLNGFSKNDSTKRWYPDVPADMYFADGFGGQDIYVIPSRKLVVVRLGLHIIRENRFLKEVIASIRE